MSLDDFHFDKREKNFFEAVKQALDIKLKPITEELKHIGGYLQKRFNDFKPVVQSGSLKRITEQGQKIIEKHNVEDYLKEKCDLLKKDFSGKTDTEIFIECDKWVKEKGKTKFTEIRIHTNINEDVCKELVALCLLYKIKKSISDK